jgi:type I restriction enzyme, S subunit
MRIAIGRVGAYCGSLYRVLGKCWISDNAISAQSKINANMFSYYVLNSTNLNERSEGTGQPLITQGLLNGIRITIPEVNAVSDFERIALTIFENQDKISQEIGKLKELKDLLLSKLATLEN